MTAPAPPPAAPDRGARRRWWLITAVTGWAVLLLVLAYVSVRTDPPTVPDQRSLAQALPVLERAAGELLAAVGDAGVAEIGELDIDRGCRLTPARDGARAHRDLLVYVPPGAGPAVLDRVAAALPPAYRAGVRHNAEHVLRADAGEFVALRGVVEDGGALVRLRASTGCRPAEDGVPSAEPASQPSATGPLAEALSALRLPAATPTTVRQVPCPRGGTARTATAQARSAGVDLGAALLAVTAEATVVRAEPATVAYRAGATSVVVYALDGIVHAAATVPC